MFASQADALRDATFSTSLCPEQVLRGKCPLANIPNGATVVYRGWMLKAKEYEQLVTAINAAGAETITSPAAYLATHHLPNWYPLVKEFTPATYVFAESADLPAKLSELGWNAFFVKDYVKSLKTARGSIIHDPRELPALLQEMRNFRGEIEGGICIRQVESLIARSERRCFVIDGRAFFARGHRPTTHARRNHSASTHGFSASTLQCGPTDNFA